MDKTYLQEKEAQCRYRRDNWSHGHQCNKYELYSYEFEKKLKKKLKKNTPVALTVTKEKKNTFLRCGECWIPSHKCRTNHTTDCKIIKRKEVHVSVEKDTSNFDANTSSSDVSITTITCIQQTCKDKDLETLKKVNTQQK